MKKLFTLLMLIMALLSLAACGGETPAPAEQPAETTEEAAEETSPASASLPAPYYLTFAPGETAEQDIDGDGQADQVRVWLEDGQDDEKTVCLSVNGEDLSQALTDEFGGFYCPDEDCWLLTDLDTEDGMLEIAIQDWGPSDDLTTSFYHYEAETLTSVGMVEGFVVRDGAPADVTFDGDGTVHSYLRLDVLQTWWGKAASVLDRDGVLVLLPQDYYESIAETPQQVTALCDLCAYDAPGGQQEVLPAGSELELLGTDDVEWVCARLVENEREIWLHLDPESPFEVEVPDGFIGSWDALDGLCMAD